MSLIPLKSINFVNTKVELKNQKTFISGSTKCNNLTELGLTSAGISGSLNDLNSYSKSIININLLSNLSSEIDYSNVSSSALNIINYKRRLNDLVFNDNSTSDNFKSYFTILDHIRSLSTTNNSSNNSTLDLYNANKFLNNFNVKKLIPRYSYDDYHLRKKNILKNNTYKYYRHNKDVDNLRNIYWGFNNYNTINFFSQKFNNSKTHTNCIVYPNLKIDDITSQDKNVYNFINNDSFNVSFYINKRKEKGLDNPGCIMHIPGLISVYLVNGTGKNIKGDIKNYKLGFVFGEETYKNINIGSTTKSYSSDNILVSNSWHHVSLNIVKTSNTSVSLSIYIDGILNSNSNISGITFANLSGSNSYITLGNKPKYKNVNNNTERQRFFIQCFSQHLDTASDVNGPYFEKHIEFNGLGTYDISDTVNSINSNDRILFEDSINNSESLSCELHDIRIYKKSKSSDDISLMLKNSVEKISEESNIDFLIPVLFTPTKVRKKSIYSASTTTRHLRYTSVINPFFANFCGGYEVSIENFCKEFNKKISPNIIIGGSSFENIIDSRIKNSVDSLVTYASENQDNNLLDYQRIRKGETSNKIYLDNLVDTTRRSSSIEACNLVYINNMILPNDNGLQFQKYDLVKNTFTISSEDLKYNEIEENTIKYNHVNVDKFINNTEYSEINIFNNSNLTYEGNSEEVFFNINKSYDWNRTDNLYNIDAITYNLEYTESEFVSQSSKIFSGDFYKSKINQFNSQISDDIIKLYDPAHEIIDDIYVYTNSNIIKKDFKDSAVIIDEISTQIDIKSTIHGPNPVNSQVYNKFILPYNDFNKDYFYPTNIIEISSQFYNKKIEKESLVIEDVDLLGSNGNLSIKIKDNGYGCLYRSDCNTKVATWNYLGHIFYSEGISVIHHPGLENFGYSNFNIKLKSENSLFVNEINIPCESGMINESVNTTYNKDLRSSDSAFDSDESFVYITDINLHDENLNIVAKAKLAQPVPKKNTDNILFRLKMDY